MRRILALARAEVLHVIRDRATLAQIFVVPIVQLLVLSNAATFEVRDTSAYVVDQDRTAASRGLVDRFVASGHFIVIERAGSSRQADRALLDGKATLVLTIPNDFEASLVRTGGAAVQIVVNAEKGSAAGIVQSYAARILSAYALALGPELRPQSMAGASALGWSAPRVDVQVRHWYNPTLNYKHYMVPGILVSLVTLIATLLSAQNIAREKELGTLEQLNVTPITRGQFITAKLLPFWGLAMADFALGLAVGWLVFDIPIRGSLSLLFAVASVYLLVVLAIGLWISALVDTQQQAMFVTFFVMMVYLLMSGLYTPVDSMPPWVQVVSEFTPVRHFVEISRAILVKGAGLSEIARPLAVLAGYAIVMWLVAIRQYSKRTA
jgi:ABC-2 type transport system permease protein